MRSYFSSAKKQGINVYHAIQLALDGMPENAVWIEATEQLHINYTFLLIAGVLGDSDSRYKQTLVKLLTNVIFCCGKDSLICLVYRYECILDT